MSFFHYSLPFLFSLCLLASAATDQQTQLQTQQGPPGTRNLFVVVQKDAQTGLHVATLLNRSPPDEIRLLVDINGPYILVDCLSRPYVSRNYNAPLCGSTRCSLVAGPNHACFTCTGRGPPRPGCHNGTCGVTVSNPLTRQTALGELAQDAFSIREVRRTPPFFVRLSPFFVCAPPVLQQTQGVAGLGPSRFSLRGQLVSSVSGLSATFATCLARATAAKGGVFFGNGPYLRPSATPTLTSTPLSVSRNGEYFITLSGIKINNKVVPRSVTRALISTTVPFTVLEHSIYAAVTRFFYEQYKRAPQVRPPAAPFELCFDEARIANMPPPAIDLVLQSGGGVWRFLREHSLVEARPGVMCLAFVDGGRARPGRGAITIGAHQLEEVLVQIDLERSLLGFSSSLLRQGTSCSNYNM